MIKSSNPALRRDTFEAIASDGRSEAMTVDGAVNKTVVLALLVLGGALVTWNLFKAGSTITQPLMFVGGIGGFILALIISFNKKSAGVLAPVYAVLKGLLLGGLSAFFEAIYPGIAIQAILLTLGVLFSLLLVYKLRIIKVTERFKMGVFAATAGIGLYYLIAIVAGLFGLQVPFIHDGGTFGILFSLGVVVIAALNLVIDFDFIEQGATHGAPKYMEWYSAFGLMVTLIWLYIEILRLLSKLRD